MKALAFSGGKDSMACLHLLKGKLDCAIYVDTGFSYPETNALVEYASSMVRMITVKSDRQGQNEREGIPADVVPVNWTKLGQSLTGPKNVMIQSYLGCCFENLYQPLMEKAHELGVKTLYLGQREEETHKSPLPSGSVVDGIERIYPINDWTKKQVLDFLAERMEIPEHYSIERSSLDCYDCTAYTEDRDLLEWMHKKHPDFYRVYFDRAMKLNLALEEAIGD